MPVEIKFCDVCGELECEDQQACDDERVARTAHRALFTFGFGHVDPLTDRTLANRYVWVAGRDLDDCKTQMIERFGHRYKSGGGNWAFDYPSEDDAGVARWHLIEIDFETGDDLPTEGR